MTDEEFLSAFESCSLPEREWTHAAHVRMAWLYLRRRPLAEVVAVVREGIQRYNGSLKKPSGYHETITCAFLRLIGNRLRNDGAAQSFAEFSACHPDLMERGMSILLRYYRKETLFSAPARATFVHPDLLALPDGDELA